YATPAVVGDVLYISSCAGRVVALDRGDGTPRWTADVRVGGHETSIHGDPLIAESLLVVGTDGTSADTTIGAVWALERATGQVRWRPRVRRWERRRRLRAGSGLGTSPVATQRRIGDQHGPPGPRVATVPGDRTWPAGPPEPGD